MGDSVLFNTSMCEASNNPDKQHYVCNRVRRDVSFRHFDVEWSTLKQRWIKWQKQRRSNAVGPLESGDRQTVRQTIGEDAWCDL